MPHFIIECSHNIVEQVAPSIIIKEMHNTAESTGLFSKEDIKVRIKPYENYLVGGEQSDFIHVFGNIMEGRSEVQKNSLAQSMVKKLDLLFPNASVVSINIRDFKKVGYCNKSMI